MENAKTVEICGKQMRVASIDYDKCRKCQNGACANRLAPYARPDRIAALCNRTCLCVLEQEGRLKNVFEKPFRKREAWSKDLEGKPIAGATESMGRENLKGAEK